MGELDFASVTMGGSFLGPKRLRMRDARMRFRALFVSILPLLISCGRIKSCAGSLVGNGDEESEAKAPPAHGGSAAPTSIEPHPRIWLDKPTLERLAQRKSAGIATWARLDAKCKARMEGALEWPEGKDFPDPGIGEGHLGSGYWEAVLDLALCARMARGADDARAKALAARAADVLEKMSELAGPHAVDPLRDEGFGVRYFVPAMAIGYDWLDTDLTPALKERLRASMTRWIEALDASRSSRGAPHPGAHRFAGYYNAKALAALATQGDFDKSPAWWADWHDRLHKKSVQPFYAKHMVGGGSPEGWDRGALATLDMTWPVWAALTAKKVDLFRDPAEPYSFPFDQALHMVHFAWPDRVHIDDRGALSDGSGELDEVAAAPLWPATVLPALLRRFDDPFAAVLQRYAREVRERASKKQVPAWMDFLYWEASAPEADYSKLQRSYVAWGMQTASMRSGWDEQAVWASFTSGTYVGSPDAAEMPFDQGSLSIVRGNRPLLVNATAALERLAPGETAPRGDDPIREDLFGNHDKDPRKGNRTLFNVFYARQKPAAGKSEPEERYGQIAAAPGKPRTRLRRYEDKDAWVLLRGEHLEDMFRRGKNHEPRVTGWTRQVLYVRPSVFVIEDRTEVSDPELDQWLSFHLASPVAARRDAELGAFDVGTAGAFGGTFAVVQPKGATTKTVDVFDRHKVTRVEVRPPAGSKDKSQHWLTVFDAAAAGPGPSATKVRGIDGIAGTVGALVEAVGGPIAVVSTEAGAASYRAPVGTTHYLTGLEPKQELKISTAREAAGAGTGTATTYAITTVKAAGGVRASDGGVIAFRVDESGGIVSLSKP